MATYNSFKKRTNKREENFPGRKIVISNVWNASAFFEEHFVVCVCLSSLVDRFILEESFYLQ